MLDDLTSPLDLVARPWAIRREVLARLAASPRDSWQRLAAATETKPRAARRTSAQRAGGAVAVIPLSGVITPRGSWISMLFGGGGGGLIDFRDAFREAIQSPDVGAIVLDVDSPGGLVDLVPETAAEILAARGSKPIVAVANTMAASAAYFIASQADEVVVTPSGSVGSVGVYMVHEDWSGMNERMGIDPTYVVSEGSPHKAEGNADEPLSDAARADWQQEVDDLYAMFASAVAAGRGVSVETVRSDYGQGRTMLADRALAAGMVDRVDTLEAVIGGLLEPGAATGAAALAGRRALALARAEATPPAADDEPVDDDPTHVPDDAPPVDPPADPVEPDVGPDAPADAEARAAVAAVLI